MEDKNEEKKDPAEAILELIKKYYKGIKKREDEGIGAD